MLGRMTQLDPDDASDDSGSSDTSPDEDSTAPSAHASTGTAICNVCRGEIGEFEDAGEASHYESGPCGFRIHASPCWLRTDVDIYSFDCGCGRGRPYVYLASTAAPQPGT
jgi:hypothetical protein